MSLCRKHFQRVEARLSQAAEAGDRRDDLNNYELMLIQLHDDVLKIKDMKSTDNKNRVKAQVLPNYLPWVDGVNQAVAASDSEHFRQDDVFAQVFVWAIDLLDLSLVESMFATISKAGMTLPERFKRAPVDFMLDQLAEAVIDDKKTLDLSAVHRLDELTSDMDTHDEVRAKWFKAIGLLYENSDDVESLQKAYQYFGQAYALNNKIGVVKRMESLERAIKQARESIEEVGSYPPPEKDKK